MMIYQWFKRKLERKVVAKILYQVALTQSRRPEFYENMGVSDTMDGRFDLLSLHVYLMIDRLNEFGSEGAKQGQSLFDSMFRRMELDLREMGVGDLGVPKHMAKMMKAFNGRAHVYKNSLKTLDIISLETAIAKNIYRAEVAELSPQMLKNVSALTDYAVRMNAMLKDLSFDDIRGGKIIFPVFISEDSTQQQRAS